ncbi:putative copper homeostasis protein cutc protein [Botrytis fragariae]|uniref:Copper homeostasis protein cutC homolog n=1 Tax=Botrytis fragariae TaxID=1964551 RepID=A0A8H6AND6_9HELO|nr:putative copper homeostasis protein cutc protein [Botrytis fragariae]KAF5870953.1 putative copper homeostasis protein cutc protein [Botrytis fragariae]
MPNLEIAAFTPSSALLALKSGARRIELCAHKDKDGLTPDVKDFSSVYSALHAQNEKRFDGKVNEKKEEEEDGEINIMIRPVDNSSLGVGPDDNFRVGDELINLNFTSLLTSGGAPTSVQGVVQLQKLVQQAAGRIDIIVGGGVRSRNLEELVQETGAGWFHSSAVVGDGENVNGEEVEKMRDILGGTRVG